MVKGTTIKLNTSRRWIALAAVIVTLSGCDRGSPRPAACGLPGIDVSRHQNEIDWAAVAGSGIAFAWIKATEGGDFLDVAFRRNWVLASAAGLKRGAYHFATWCRPGQDQADWFIAHVPADPDALPPVLDVEWNLQSRSCPQPIDPATARIIMKIILAAMEKTYGTKPIIYAPRDFYQDVMRGEFESYPLWARTLGRPPAGYDDRTWRLWQHSETGTVSGVTGDVDLDCLDQGGRLR